MFKFLVLTTLLALGNALNFPFLKNKDTTTTIDKVAHMVSLYKNGVGICGGSIISKDWVLTAGHCINDFTKHKDYTVLEGAENLENSPMIHKVSKLIVHSSYLKNRFQYYENDIALVKVEQPFDFNKNLKPVPLYEKYKKIADGTSASLSGWGGKKRLEKKHTIPHLVDVKIIGIEKCTKKDKGLDTVGLICTNSYKGENSFSQRQPGDSIIVNGHLAGLVSLDPAPLTSGKVIIYAEIAHHRDWIHKHSNV